MKHVAFDSHDWKCSVADQVWNESYLPRLEDRIIVDEKKKLIYIFDVKYDKNIRVLEIRDNNKFELLNDKIYIPLHVRHDEPWFEFN